MCGRYTLSPKPHAIEALMAGLGETAGPLPTIEPRYNIAPTQLSWAITVDADARLQLRPMAFGFRPSFMSHGVINARAETITGKPLFRKAFAQSRCLVLATGFYEWAKAADGKKLPHHFSLSTGSPFVFAGLYRNTQPQDPGHGHHIEEFVIITTEANACVAPVHPRMPVIASQQAARLWLAQDTEPPLLETLLAPFDSDAMVARAVNARVNRPTADDPSCLASPEALPAKLNL